MSAEFVDRGALLGQLQNEAEQHVEAALTAVRAAHQQATALDPDDRDLFEYGEATRALRAALTAIRSARLHM